MEELKELKKYKSAREFARAHGKKAAEEDISFGDILKGVAKDGVAFAAEKINSEFLDPYGVFYEPSAEAKAEGERLKRLEELDAARPEIKSHLVFSIMPEEKAKGLHAKIGLFAKSWNQFVDEIKEGRMEIAEVLIVALDDADWSDDKEEYYVKIADLDGRVLKGGIRKIKYDMRNFDDRIIGGWIRPEDYRFHYDGRTEEEYNLYDAFYQANAYAEVVDPSDKIHAYVLHFHRKKKEYYGLIAQKEYENLKELKDYITFMTPDNAFEPENHHGLEFDW